MSKKRAKERLEELRRKPLVKGVKVDKNDGLVRRFLKRINMD